MTKNDAKAAAAKPCADKPELPVRIALEGEEAGNTLALEGDEAGNTLAVSGYQALPTVKKEAEHGR